MRDVLTVLAGVVIAVLAAALIVPPFLDWSAYRDAFDAALSRAAGTEARTEGHLALRLLPTPRMEVERLRLGGTMPAEPSLDASEVRTEIALTPLLHGEVRFLETRILRAEIRVPTGVEGDWRLPRELFAGPVVKREWAFEDLTIGQLLVTAIVPATGRTDQFFAQDVAIQGQTLAGPWRVEGRSGTVPFQLVTGEWSEEHTLLLKLSGGGDQNPRFEADAKLSFLAGPAETLVPTLVGTAKVLLGPPAEAAATGLPIPVQIQAGFSARAKTVELEAVSIEAGTGGASVRLGGTGSISGDEPRIQFTLEGRRVDIDSFILSPSGGALAERASRWSLPKLPIPIAFQIKLDSIGLAQEELTNFSLRAALTDGNLRVDAIEIVGPGQTRLRAEGEVRPSQRWATSARIAVTSPASERLARYLGRLGVPARLTGLLDGRPLEASADLLLDPALSSVRNLNVRLGESTLTGTGRYTAPDGDARGRIDAQLALMGLDLTGTPQLGSFFETIQNLDIGLILDARGLGYGGRTGAGRISARISSDGPALLVERLEIVDLAGANANVSGRIAPDGTGRIDGRLTAPRAAPLVDLLGQVWLGGLSGLTPSFLREGGLDLSVAGERAFDPRSGAPGLRTSLRGLASGARFEADVVSQGAVVQTLNLTLATDRSGLWLGAPDAPELRRPARVELRGTRLPTGQLTLAATGEMAGLRFATGAPLAFGRGDDVVESGDVTALSDNINPFLSLMGDGAAPASAVPIDLRVVLGRDRDGPQYTVAGKVAGETVEARLAQRQRGEIGGSVAVSSLPLPWFVSALALNAPSVVSAGSIWSTTRFGTPRRTPSGQITINAKAMDLGRGLSGEGAVLTASLSSEGLTVRDLSFGLAGGRVTGAFGITRQGSLASLVGEANLANVALPLLAGPGAPAGRLSGTLRLGGSGETASGLVANLGGSGSVQIADLVMPGADPAAVDRAAARALRDSDPLGARRLEAIVSEELARANLAGSAPAAPATMVGGALRIAPLSIAPGPGSWQGTLGVDLKTLAVEARGTLTSTLPPPRGWLGGPPYILLGWRGPLAALRRDVDVAPLTNGLASIVLQRELDKVEAFEADASERARLNSRREMDQARRLAEEAARVQRLREQQEAERLRLAEDAARQAREQLQLLLQQSVPQTPAFPGLPQPLEIRPAPQIRPSPGG